ncbi:MAG: hypothetical protein J2O48_03915, partial [Solirubrobacterales bacterium]|nr:hypothetical protein [Solirubrobacterales bacterium]
AAFHAAINTVNVGKFNLGPGAVGTAEHAFYEAITHAENRILFGHRVTEFPQVEQIVTDSYARLLAMKLYTERAVDYMRSASPQDRRYLLIDSIEKMNVTRQCERIIRDLSDVIAARAFENDMYFPMAMLGALGLPRLEGTVHVNMALALKFMANYMFHPSDAALATLRYLPGDAPAGVTRTVSASLKRASRAVAPGLAPAVPALVREFRAAELKELARRRDFADDEFLFRQGPSSGLSKVRFRDWRPVFEAYEHVPNVARFFEQAEAFQTLLAAASPTAEQQKDVSFLFALGELFTLIPYAQLILEQAGHESTSVDVLDQIFDVLVREFSLHAVTLHAHPTATKAQQVRALDLVRRPLADRQRFWRVCCEARAHANTYEMQP